MTIARLNSGFAIADILGTRRTRITGRRGVWRAGTIFIDQSVAIFVGHTHARFGRRRDFTYAWTVRAIGFARLDTRFAEAFDFGSRRPRITKIRRSRRAWHTSAGTSHSAGRAAAIATGAAHSPRCTAALAALAAHTSRCATAFATFAGRCRAGAGRRLRRAVGTAGQQPEGRQEEQETTGSLECALRFHGRISTTHTSHCQARPCGSGRKMSYRFRRPEVGSSNGRH